ncbi:MAG: geranylgeranyl reductase family protein, partial [Methanobacteriota archaeon]
MVGAGPVGSHAARLLAEAGHTVALFEEHEAVGLPVQCSGLFTPRVFEEVGRSVDKVKTNRIRGAHLHSPRGKTVTVEGADVKLWAVDRAAFDRTLAEFAVDAGADRSLGSRVTGFVRDADGVRLSVKRREGTSEVTCRLLVGADGVQSQVARAFGLTPPLQLLSCYGAEMDGVVQDPEFVEMYAGLGTAPGFFSWIAPTGPTSAKVEVGVFRAPRAAKYYWQRMFHDARSAPRLRDARPLYEIAACIPLGPAKKTVADRVATVGDAASQAKPVSGGGVYTGLRCARHLATVASEALTKDDLSAGTLREYE